MSPKKIILIGLALIAVGCGPLGYVEKDGKMYYCTLDEGNGYQKYEMGGVDLTTFERISGSYAKDANHVYCAGRGILGADPKTFSHIRWAFSRDAHHVFSDTKVFSDDPDHFQIINDIGWCKDSTHVYYNGLLVEGTDPATFVQLDEGRVYYKDKNRAYLSTKPILDSDPATFRHLIDLYSKDAKNVYYRDQKIEGADSATFEIINKLYAKDAKNIYYKDKILPGADVTTFHAIGKYDFEAADKYHTYKFEKVLE